MHKEEHMAEIIKFIYVMIMIFLISKNVDGKLFFYPFQFFYLLYTQFYSLFFLVIAAVFSCLQDSECPHNLCPAPSESNCIYGVCNCVIKSTNYHDR